MNTQEFAEWLRERRKAWIAEAAKSTYPYGNGYANGYADALGEVLSWATTLDSSHDLPSTKG